jgi:hypothetical protein
VSNNVKALLAVVVVEIEKEIEFQMGYILPEELKRGLTVMKC